MSKIEFYREKYSVQYKIKENDDDAHYDLIDQVTYIDAELDVNDGVNHEKAKEKVLKKYPKAEIFNCELIENEETVKAKKILRDRIENKKKAVEENV